MPASMKRTPSEDLVNLAGRRGRDGVAFDEDRLRIGKAQGVRKRCATSMATPGGTIERMRSASPTRRSVVVDNLDAGALDPLEARCAAARIEVGHPRAAFAQPPATAAPISPAPMTTTLGTSPALILGPSPAASP